MKIHPLLLLFIFLFLLISYSCKPKTEPSGTLNKKIEVKHINNSFKLYRNNEPYFIKGAGGYQHYDALKAAGGNSIRIWSTENAKQILDEAHKLGLTVIVGLKVAYAKTELDYNDPQAVERQLKELKKEVLTYKDHPALLMWGIGNEPTLHLSPYDFLQHNNTWSAIDDIAKMIHELDPHHPTTTMLQDISPITVFYISSFCKNIDILSVNIFRDVKKGSISKELRSLGWTGPYILSEYGALGYWAEEKQTDWYSLFELTSTNKADFIQRYYEQYIEADSMNCLGSYIFYWGQKNEYTPTWLSLFTDKGERTDIIDRMQFIWTKQWPLNRAPSIHKLTINKLEQPSSIYLNPNESLKVDIVTHDVEADSISIFWEIIADDSERHFDATYNQESNKVIKKGVFHAASLFLTKDNLRQNISLQTVAPSETGPYRLYIYVKDKTEGVATANIPFYVVED
ncbi:glycoside hydrolase family 2 TIM barrel-domain containing protein [Pontibacter burrus]|uniref:Glycoside hydrolase family 2 catalytic domain-containing protein n=1 Tax=Pontibacter burrus TaxID=2704466 RepID=A0A6B3LW94_9BACT|nr:glycoside hydrolase family 2 TIM barrel-domain containing protein [Pontibacter burrus]NEM97757.1 hypothetical protein [Pontibacter burrus]